ncbi:MAG: helix-turn-helix domain-containing protein [Bacteroidales bacterium]|nr:helix-turn-helix domain-containing protein [Bacteroidales bacterium]
MAFQFKIRNNRKSRKEVTLNKLETNKINLEKINAILDELYLDFDELTPIDVNDNQNNIALNDIETVFTKLSCIQNLAGDKLGGNLSQISHPKKTILLVEPGIESSTFLKHNLVDGYEIFAYQDESAVMNFIENNFPDIIIIDIEFDNFKGTKFCELIKTHSTSGSKPVIMIGNENDDLQEILALKSGADAFIPKPLKIDLLKALIDNLIHRYKLPNTSLPSTTSLTQNDKNVSIKTEQHFLKKIEQITLLNISNPNFTPKYYSKELKISKSALYRNFTKYIGTSPNEYIKSMRMQKAAELLRQHNISIHNVAELIGFSDHSYFSQCFKKEFGISPKDFNLNENL